MINISSEVMDVERQKSIVKVTVTISIYDNCVSKENYAVEYSFLGNNSPSKYGVFPDNDAIKKEIQRISRYIKNENTTSEEVFSQINRIIKDAVHKFLNDSFVVRKFELGDCVEFIENPELLYGTINGVQHSENVGEIVYTVDLRDSGEVTAAQESELQLRRTQ